MSFPNIPGPYTGQTSLTWIVPRCSLCFPAGEPLPVSGRSAMITSQGVAFFNPNSTDGQKIRIAVQRSLEELDSEGLKTLQWNKAALLDVLRGKDDNVPELAPGETSDLCLWPSNVLSISSGWVSNSGKGRVLIMGTRRTRFHQPGGGGKELPMAIEDADGLGLILVSKKSSGIRIDRLR